jgi:hypothetical protein
LRFRGFTLGFASIFEDAFNLSEVLMTPSAFASYFLAATAVLASACNNRANVQCEQNSNCDISTGGVCEPANTGSRWCAYPDATCPAGFRYSNQDVGDGIGGQCVVVTPVDAGTGGHDTGPDTGPPIQDWVNHYGSAGTELGQNIVVAPNGDLVVIGRFNTAINLGGATLTSHGDVDLWVARYAPDGSHVWSKSFGGTGTDFPLAISFDAAGDVYVSGEFDGSVDFGGGVRASTNTGNFLLKLRGTDGAYIWDRILGTKITARAAISSIAQLDSSTMVVGGFFNGTVDFGGGAVARQTPSGSDAFVAAYATSGNLKWFRQLSATDNIGRFGGLAVSSGDVFATGGFTGDASVGGAVLHSAGGEDFFVARYHGADGTHMWSIRDGGANYDSTNGTQLLAIADTHVVVGGAFEGTTNIAKKTLTSSGPMDGFVAAYNAVDGSPAWVTALGGTASDNVVSVAATPTRIAVALDFQGAVTIGGQSLTAAGGTSATEVAFARLSLDAGVPLVASQFPQSGTADIGYVDDRLIGLVTFDGSVSFFGTSMVSQGLGDVSVFRVSF